MRGSGRGSALQHDALRQGAGGFEVLHIIHQLQRLQRGVAAFAAGAGLLAVRGIEVRS